MELSTSNAFDPGGAERPRSGTYDARVHRAARRYEIISELGGGAMSAVRLAHDTATGRVVAIKSLTPDAAAAHTTPAARRRLAREAAILQRLRHPNIVEVVDVEREGDAAVAVAVVTEYVRGRSLRDVLADAGALPIERAVDILRDVAAALAHAHAQGIVHCDVKPANILLDEERDRAVLIDFGIACDSGTRPDADGDELTVGTPVYMAPEQIEARAVDPRTDVYSLCIVAWELLAGRMPWLGAPLADVLHRQRYESLPDLALVRPDVPLYLLDAIDGGLAKDPARRWRDGAELLRHLSPRALSVAAAHDAHPPLDATIRIATVRDVVPEPEPYGTLPGRRTRVLASSIAVAALLGLGAFAPRLSHATAHPRATVDPELDSMLTLAVHPHRDRGATAGKVSACAATSRARRATHCPPPTPHHPAPARAALRARQAASRR